METKAEKQARKDLKRQSRESAVTSVSNTGPIDCACVIHGNSYNWIYVERLYNMLTHHIPQGIRFHVYTEHDRSVPPHMIKHCLQEWDGIAGPKRSWWYKLQLFNPEHHHGNLLYLDLDVVILNNLDWVTSAPTNYFWTIRDFRYLQKPIHKTMNSSLMWFNVDRYSWIWQDFANSDVSKTIRQYPGDQDYLQATIPSEQVRMFADNKLQSWRWQVADGGYNFKTRQPLEPGSGAKISPNASIIVFHGYPKPHQVTDPVIANFWQ